jgi:hypothetical protein
MIVQKSVPLTGFALLRHALGGLSVGLPLPSSAFPLSAAGIAISRRGGIRPDARTPQYLA